MAVNQNIPCGVNNAQLTDGSVFDGCWSCYLCGESLRRIDPLICGHCRTGLPHNINACRTCARPVRSSTIVCGDCIQYGNKRYTCQSLALFRYEYPVNRLIYDLKYHAHLEIASLFGAWIAESALMAGMPLPQCFIPVPLHRSRIVRRGFNQSMELALSIGKTLGIPVRHDLCFRNRDTPPQTTLSTTLRMSNVRGAFSCTNTLPDQLLHAVIVDDVITTGHTINELAGVLVRSGIARVDVWACARATAVK
jgi:Predicted amidophosphoribosyltransferases